MPNRVRSTFKVDDLEEARKKVEEAGATFQPLGGKATGQGVVDVEVKYYLPNEVRIDLSESDYSALPQGSGFVRNACVDNHYVSPNRQSPCRKIS